MTDESTREIDRLCARLDQAEAEVARLRAVLTRIAGYQEWAQADLERGAHSNLSAVLCQVAKGALKAKD
jgi:hypothetical protein